MNPDLQRARSSRDYSTMQLWTVSWEDFSSSPFIRRVKHIHGFNFLARLSGLGRWNEVVDPSRFALRVLNSLEEALDEAGFVNLPAVQTTIEPELVMFRYQDSEFGFDLTFRGDGSVHLRREGSTLETFHRWYVGLMPSIPAILMRAMAALDSELERVLRVGGSAAPVPAVGEQGRDRIKLLSASFNFRVILHNFREVSDHQSLPDAPTRRNLDVMRANVAVRVPDTKGVMKDNLAPIDFQRYGRMDYKVNLRHELQPTIGQFLTVEAPSNANWRALFFDLAYVGENYYANDEQRHRFDQELFLSSSRCADAYISFFRDIGLEGFVQSVTRDFMFETTADVIS